MSNLPTWAEDIFSAECHNSGARCSPPRKDMHGWDFFVELPERDYVGPAESSPPRPTAFVQVKFTEKNVRRSNIKLSNMLNACNSESPWFIVLVDRSGRLYGLHVWSELIERSLTAIRKADKEDAPLHKRYISINFSPKTKITTNVVTWMLEQIHNSGGEYSELKKKLYNELGYEHAWAHGHLQIEASNYEEIARAFLGLGDGIVAKKFSIVKTRFGIDDTIPYLEVEEGIVRLDPEPSDAIEIRIRGERSESPLLLQGNVYVHSPPGIAPNKRRLRFSAPPVEIIHNPNGKCDFSLLLDQEEPYSLNKLEAYSKIIRWSAQGLLNISIVHHGQPTDYARINLDRQANEYPIWFWHAVEALGTLRVAAGKHVLEISLSEIFDALPNLAALGFSLAKGRFRFSFQSSNPESHSYKLMNYYMATTVGQWRFDYVVQRPIISINIRGDRVEITADGPLVVEAFVGENVTIDDGAYQSPCIPFLESLAENAEIFNLGDFRHILKRTSE